MNIDEQIREAKKRSNEARREYRRYIKQKKNDILKIKEGVKENQQLRGLAFDLHDRFCHFNHTDGCGWHYEKEDWQGNAHQYWLDRAKLILALCRFHYGS